MDKFTQFKQEIEKLNHLLQDENDYQLEYGNKTWRNKEGQIHRDNDQPAIISSNGTQLWYKKGKCHRDNDKPAVIYADGAKYWFKEGVEYIPS